MSTARSLRVLIHKPVMRAAGPYFRVQQYVASLDRQGHRAELLDLGRLPRSAWRKPPGALRQIAVSIGAFARSDVVFVTPHPLVSLYVALAKLLGAHVVLDQILTYVFHDEVMSRFPRTLDRWAYRLADGVLTHSETMRRELMTATGIDPSRIEVVYPVVDLELFSRRHGAEAAALRHALGIEDRFVVMYHGNWHPWHGAEVLLEAARRLENCRDIVFVMIRGGLLPDTVNVRFVDEQPFERLPVYLQMADVWCSGFDSDPRGERAFSSTLIQALALGLPVVTGRAGERAQMLREGVEARLVPLRDPVAIAEAVLALRADPAARKAMGSRARAFAEAHFSIARLDRGIADLLRRVTSEGPRPGLGRGREV